VNDSRRNLTRFRGWISCRRDGEGPLGLILVGRTEDQPDEAVQIAFACPAPVDMPEALEDVLVERLGPAEYRVTSGDRSWTLLAPMHLHREVSGPFYKALPPRPVPWRKRLFWRVLLGLASRPLGRRLLMRGR
jgi:hypothetical protein